MLKGYVMIQSLSQCIFSAYPKRDKKIKYSQNISILCSKRHDLSMSLTRVTTNQTHKNGSTRITSGLPYGLRLGRMTEDGLSYKECFIVRSYEVGINKTVTVETIANLLQEVGCNHVQAIGFSTDGFATTPTMRKLRLIWVTARMHIEMHKYPAWCDVIEIETWCQPEGKIGIRRDLILKDYANGDVIGRATCKWVMMSMDTRKLVRVSPQIAEEYAIHCPKALRLAFPEENNNSLKKIPKLTNPGHYSRLGLRPRRSDLDMNQHVNNVTYIEWVRESMPQEIINSHELGSITLDYRQECQQDDVVDSLTSVETTDGIPSISLLKGKNRVPSTTRNDYDDDGVQFLHLLKLSFNGSEINRGRSEWRRKPQR